MNFIAVLPALFMLLFAADGVVAANIRVDKPFDSYLSEDGRPLPCHVRLEGPIVLGDLDRLKPLIPQDVSEGQAESKFVLCLNSNGGKFVEGIRIAQYAIEHGITTQIEDQAICFSACAIIFLGGTYRHWEDGRFLSRYLHVRAALGFHAPFLEVPPGRYDKETVEAAYLASVLSIAELTALSKKGSTNARGDRIKPSLLEQILRTGSSQLYFINTVKQAARWNIDLVGWTVPQLKARSQYFNICANTLLDVGDLDEEFENTFDIAKLPLDLVEVMKSVRWTHGGEGQDVKVAAVNFGGYYGIGCEIEMSNNAGTSAGRRRLRFLRSDHGSEGYATPPLWTAFPPQTPIRSLP